MPAREHAIRVRPIDKIIGQNVIWHRSRLSLTQQELGERIGMVQPAVLNYENGKTKFTVAMVMRFAKALNKLSWKELLKNLPDEIPEAWEKT